VRRFVTAGLAAIACVVTLSGCILIPPIPVQAPQQTPHAPDGQQDPAPEGWAEFEPCDPSDRWIWVEGFPADEMEAAGLEPECGGTYFGSGSPTYTSAGDRSVSDEQLEELRAQLEAAGYEQTASSFEHPEPGDAPGLAGSWQYERNAEDPDAAEVIFVVNFSAGTDPVQYQTFVDYESPATRDLET
jgi:hypothetical protein